MAPFDVSEALVKKLLLAGVAALSLLNVAAAQTSATKAELPDAMLGAWCGQRGWQFLMMTRNTGGAPMMSWTAETVVACASAKMATITTGLDHRALVSSLRSNSAAMANLKTI
jgi:hypothetical protein